MVIFGHRRGGVQPPKDPEFTLFLGKIFKFQGGSGPRSPPLDSRMHYENLPMQYTEIFSPVKTENFMRKNLIFFLFLLKT